MQRADDWKETTVLCVFDICQQAANNKWPHQNMSIIVCVFHIHLHTPIAVAASLVHIYYAVWSAVLYDIVFTFQHCLLSTAVHAIWIGSNMLAAYWQMLAVC